MLLLGGNEFFHLAPYSMNAFEESIWRIQEVLASVRAFTALLRALIAASFAYY